MAYDPAVLYPAFYPDQSELIRLLERNRAATLGEVKRFTLPPDAVWEEVLRNQQVLIGVAVRGHLAFKWSDNCPDHIPVVATLTIGGITYPTVQEGIHKYGDGRARLSYWYSVEGIPCGSGREWERLGFLEAVCRLACRLRAGDNDPAPFVGVE